MRDYVVRQLIDQHMQATVVQHWFPATTSDIQTDQPRHVRASIIMCYSIIFDVLDIFGRDVKVNALCHMS